MKSFSHFTHCCISRLKRGSHLGRCINTQQFLLQISDTRTGNFNGYGVIGSALQKIVVEGLVFVTVEIRILAEELCWCLGGSSFELDKPARNVDRSLGLRITLFAGGLGDVISLSFNKSLVFMLSA